jgi:hypothetical protein
MAKDGLSGLYPAIISLQIFPVKAQSRLGAFSAAARYAEIGVPRSDHEKFRKYTSSKCGKKGPARAMVAGIELAALTIYFVVL